jgi:hypothetical protein
MDSGTWVGLYLSAVSLSDAVGSGNVRLTGNKNEVVSIFEMFDKFKPTKNYMIPPLEY